jgi:4-hydroxy-3-polyprenylbenzoate decarboxylase
MGLDATIKWPAELELKGNLNRTERVKLESEQDYLSLIKQSFSEVSDFYLPPCESDSSLAIVAMNKQSVGQAPKVMQRICNLLKQYVDIKFIIACDEDVNVRDWHDVIWAITTRMDPARDTQLVSGQSSRAELDATNKVPGEVSREWGIPIKKDPHVVQKIDNMWDELEIL